jgi:RNA polymerase sigma-70 factor (ECF subfamily)
MAAPEQTRYEALLQLYLEPLRRLVWSYARDAHESEDLLQEIAMALWTALPRFRGDCSERTWVYRVAHNTAISHIASRNRRIARDQNDGFFIEPVSSLNPESQAMELERRRRLWQAIRELPLADRQTMVLHLEGLTAVEIEGVTGLSAGSIATRLTRIRQKLAIRIKGEEVQG